MKKKQFALVIVFVVLAVLGLILCVMVIRSHCKKVNLSQKLRYKQCKCKEVTVVSAYYPIKSKASKEKYMEWAALFLKLNCNLVLFLPKECVANFKALKRPVTKKINIVVKEFEQLEFGSPAWMEIWNEQHKIDPENSYHSPMLYAIWAQKVAFMEEAIKFNPFGSDYFIWHDAGAVRSQKQLENISKFPLCKNINGLNPDTITFLEVFPFPRKGILQAANGLPENSVVTQDHIGAGIFVSHKNNFYKFGAYYRQVLQTMLNVKQFAGKEQTVYNIMYLLQPTLFNIIKPVPYDGDVWFYLQHFFS